MKMFVSPRESRARIASSSLHPAGSDRFKFQDSALECAGEQSTDLFILLGGTCSLMQPDGKTRLHDFPSKTLFGESGVLRHLEGQVRKTTSKLPNIVGCRLSGHFVDARRDDGCSFGVCYPATSVGSGQQYVVSPLQGIF